MRYRITSVHPQGQQTHWDMVTIRVAQLVLAAVADCMLSSGAQSSGNDLDVRSALWDFVRDLLTSVLPQGQQTHWDMVTIRVAQLVLAADAVSMLTTGAASTGNDVDVSTAQGNFVRDFLMSVDRKSTCQIYSMQLS